MATFIYKVVTVLILTVSLYFALGSYVMLFNRSSANGMRKGSHTSVKEPKLICIVDTHPGRIDNQVKDINITWAKRCDRVYWVSSKLPADKKVDASFRYIEYSGHDSEHWGKAMASFEYIYDKHKSDMEWVIKVSDDAFFVPENLRYFIVNNNLLPTDPIWMGSEHLKGSSKEKSVYMSREGYVLSKGAILKLLGVGKNKEAGFCNMKDRDADEEMELSKCMASLNVKSVDTRDRLGRHRFLVSNVGDMLLPIYQNKNKRMKEMKYPYQQGPNCCAQDPILLMGGSMRFFDFMLYEMRYAGEK